MSKTLSLFRIVSLALLLMTMALEVLPSSSFMRGNGIQERRVLRISEANRRPRRVRGGGDRRRGRGIGSSFRRAGASAGRGGKEFGKGMGGFGKHTGIGVAKIGKKIGKGTARGVKRIFAP